MVKGEFYYIIYKKIVNIKKKKLNEKDPIEI